MTSCEFTRSSDSWRSVSTVWLQGDKQRLPEVSPGQEIVQHNAPHESVAVWTFICIVQTRVSIFSSNSLQ